MNTVTLKRTPAHIALVARYDNLNDTGKAWEWEIIGPGGALNLLA